MSRSLTSMRADVLQILDDVNGERFSDTNVIDLAIHQAATTVGRILINAGYEEISSIATGSISGGIITLPPNEKVFHVFITSGTSLYAVTAGSGVDRSIIPNLNSTYRVEYAAKYTEPENSDGYLVKYCNVDVDDYTVDQLTALMAAETLKLTEGETLPNIDKLKAQLENSIKSKNTPQMQATSPGRFQSHAYKNYRWFKSSGTTLTIY